MSELTIAINVWLNNNEIIKAIFCYGPGIILFLWMSLIFLGSINDPPCGTKD